MKPYVRASLTLVAAGALLLGAVAGVQAADLHAQKAEAIAAAATLAGTSAPNSVQVDTAFALLRVDTAPENAALQFTLAGTPKINVLSLDGGSRIALDLGNTVNLSSNEEMHPAHPLIERVRTSLFTLEPEITSRVVLDLDLACSYRLEDTKRGVSLFLNPQDRGLAAIRTAAQTPAQDRGTEVEIAFVFDPLTAGTPVDSAVHRERDLIAELAQELSTIRTVRPEARTSDVPAIESNLTYLALLDELPALAQAETQSTDALARLDTATFSVELTRDDTLAESPDPVEERISRLARSLEAVGDVRFDVHSESYVNAALQNEEGEPDAAEATDAEAPAEDEDDATATPEGEDEGGKRDRPKPPKKREEAPVDTSDDNSALTSMIRSFTTGATSTEGVTAADGEMPAASTAGTTVEAAGGSPAAKTYTGDPLNRRVNLDFREMELSNVVALLAHMAGINVIAGTDLTGTVTASLKDVPLRQAIDTTLRMNGLGILEEEGIYHIIPYSEAVAAQRSTVMITLDNAKALEVQTVLQEILNGSPDEQLFSFSANETANVVVISGPAKKIGNLVDMAHQLDIAEPVLPTITIPIKLNYTEPDEMLATVEKMLTNTVGKASADNRARHLIVTDVPIVVEQIRTLVEEIDVPVKSVAIESMIVDVKLDDDADTGVDWLAQSVRRQSRRDAATGGPAVGNLQELSLATNLATNPTAGLLNFGLLSNDIDWRGIIQAEVRNFNGKLVSNPVLITSENKSAKIEITQEVPYTEVQQTQQGGALTNTEFKEIGTILEVTPRVTHDNSIIAEINAKESGTAGEFNGIPIEDKRQVDTTLHLENGQTMFIGGLRKNNDSTTVRKVPILGDVPVINFLFRQTSQAEDVNELLIFLTCNVISAGQPLTPYQAATHNDAEAMPPTVDAQNNLIHDTIYPGDNRDPAWKWRRNKR